MLRAFKAPKTKDMSSEGFAARAQSAGDTNANQGGADAGKRWSGHEASRERKSRRRSIEQKWTTPDSRLDVLTRRSRDLRYAVSTGTRRAY